MRRHHDPRPPQRQRRRQQRQRQNRPLFGVALAAAGLTLLAGDTTGAHQPAAGAETATSGGIAVLQAELDAMAADGLPAEHPKARMLWADLEALEQGMRTTVATEAGIDVAGRIAAGTARTAGVTDQATLDDGAVECEPLPPDLLTAAELAGAVCTSVLQPDGSSLYVAVAPDGTRSAVRFGADGTVTRQP